MKIAILLSGQPRFTGDFDCFLRNLKGYDHADWFCYMTNNNDVAKEIKRGEISLGVQIPDSWRKFTVDWAIGKLQSNLPDNNHVRSFEISDSDSIKQFPESIAKSSYKSWYNIYKANQLRLDYQSRMGIEYDMILRVRPDVSLRGLLDLRCLDLELLAHSVILPSNSWGRHQQNDTLKMCDQFAIASSDIMNVYANLYHDLQICIDLLREHSVECHPETLLLKQLRRNCIYTVEGHFQIGLRLFPCNSKKWA